MNKSNIVKPLLSFLLIMLLSAAVSVIIIYISLNGYSAASLNTDKCHDISSPITGDIYQISQVKPQLDLLASQYIDSPVCTQIKYCVGQATQEDTAVYTYMNEDSGRNAAVSLIITLDLESSRAVKVSYIEEGNSRSPVPVKNDYFDYSWQDFCSNFYPYGSENSSDTGLNSIGFFLSGSGANVYYTDSDDNIHTYSHQETARLLQMAYTSSLPSE